MRLIDADKLKAHYAWWKGGTRELTMDEAKSDFDCIIDLQPTFEQIKHGRWIWNKRLGEWYCSNCDRIMNPYTVEKSEGEYEMAQPSYCGWCGARMDEVGE